MGMYLLKFPYRRILKPLAEKLGWLHPDIVSYLAVIIAAATGWCFYRSADFHYLLIIAIVLTLLRMTLNTLDGVLAIQRNKLSLKGEVVNALPDRYSDIFVMVGITLSPFCRDWLGIAAICSMFLVSYTGMLGKALTVSWQHHGPAGKVERLVIIMVFTLVQYILMPEKQVFTIAGITATPLEWAMGIVLVLGQYTVLRRLKGQLNEIGRKEALEKLDKERNRTSAIVIYESVTGNTGKVAEQVALGLGCNAVLSSSVDDIIGYDMVVLGTPNIRKRPIANLEHFLERINTRPPMMAVFVTFGLPVWGRITAGNCISAVAGAWKMKPAGRFYCPGFHKKFKTFKRRPGEKDLMAAFLFGYRLSKKLKRYRERNP